MMQLGGRKNNDNIHKLKLKGKCKLQKFKTGGEGFQGFWIQNLISYCNNNWIKLQESRGKENYLLPEPDSFATAFFFPTTVI
ncbi:MAG: hypothetical protein AMDU4_FER2C00057G0029 [Ferroplasma sp. Type II]|jgi:hypothetical protein|nr:MAG: hypothetical protein AMDU4_FER2C00057G0029 [Ferroplasma sp. Type II]